MARSTRRQARPRGAWRAGGTRATEDPAWRRVGPPFAVQRYVRYRVLAAAILAVAYLIVAPSPADLAAQTFRADLFSAHGYVIWNNLWYSGHALPGYSVLYPPLAALLGPRVVGVLSAIAAAAAFGA